MYESRLNQCLELLSERPGQRLRYDFNEEIWRKTRETNDAVGQKGRCARLVLRLPNLLWPAAALVASVLVSFGLWFAITHPKNPDPPAVSTVTGEVVDLACYFQNGASGPDHAACARRCIESGLPVGLKTSSGKTYLLIGPQELVDTDTPRYESLNQRLAQYAAKVVNVRGQIFEKEGLSVIEGAQILGE